MTDTTQNYKNYTTVQNDKYRDAEGVSTDDKEGIANKLDIPLNDSWSIVDFNTELSVVHYREQADMTKYGGLRGIVVNKNGTVVCRSNGFNPTVVSDIIPYYNDGNIRITDENSNSYVIPFEHSSFQYGHEGAEIRVFRYGGVDYYSSRRKLDTTNSHLANSPTFRDMYFSMGGPLGSDLFHPDTITSNVCHVFIVPHSDLIIASKQPLPTNPHVIYIGNFTMWHPGPHCDFIVHNENGDVICNQGTSYPDAGYIPTGNDAVLYMKPDTVPFGTDTGAEDAIYDSPFISPEQANKHLSVGYHSSPGVTGEYVMLYHYSPDGHILNVFRIESQAYSSRSKLLGVNVNISNLRNTFFKLTRPNKSDRKVTSIIDIVPKLAYKSVDEIEALILEGPIIDWETDDSGEDVSHDSNMWYNMIMAVPLHRQKEVVGFYRHFIEVKNNLIEFLLNIYDDMDYDNNEAIEKNIRWVLNLTNKLLRNTNETRESHEIIIELVENSNGDNLYRMVRNMNRYKQRALIQEQEQDQE